MVSQARQITTVDFELEEADVLALTKAYEIFEELDYLTNNYPVEAIIDEDELEWSIDLEEVKETLRGLLDGNVKLR